MRINLNHLRYPMRSDAAGVLCALFVILALCLCTGEARAVGSPKPGIVISQVNWLTTFGSGGALSTGDAAGTTFVVNSNGDVISSNEYGNQILLFDAVSGASSVLGTYQNPGPVAIDSQNNIYLGGLYTNVVVKVPYVNGTYAAVTSPTTNPSNGAVTSPGVCKGGDTTECAIAFSSDGKTNYLDSAANGYYFGIASMAFDASGDFFYATNNAGSTGIFTIFECDTKCLTNGGDTPKIIYAEPTAANPTTTGQLFIGAMAIDPWGDLFFTDSALIPSGSSESVTSNLNELVNTAGVYASNPTVLHTLTNSSPGNYDDELDAVAIDSNGTVYFATQYDGIWAFPNASGVIDTANIYGISNQGAKMIQVTPKGDFYLAAYSTAVNSGGADTLARVPVNALSTPGAAVGKSSTATNVTVMDNNGSGCTTPPTITLSATENGKSTGEFTAIVTPPTGKATTSCATQLAGSEFPVTVTVTPTTAGERLAVMSATDGTNTGTAATSSVGQGPLVTLDPGVWTPYTTGFNSPYAIAVNAKGDLVIADSGANAVYEIASGTTTPVAIGTGFSSPGAVAFDAGGNLLIGDSGNNQIVQIPNVSGTLNAAGQRILVSDAFTFGGTVLNNPTGLAVGPHGAVYISDLGNGRVVTYNPSTGLGAVRATGLNHPWGLAVDAAGVLYVANTGGGNVLGYQGSGVVTTLTPAGVTNPWGVAVDASGSLLISDIVSGNIVRVPNEAGTLTATDALVVETNPQSAFGLALDASGNLYSTDSTGKAVYAVQRTAASLNLGSVDDDSTGEETLYVESAGNAPLTLGATIFSAPTNTMFSLGAGSPVGCSSSFKGNAGTVCEATAAFAPPNATAAGAQSGTSTLTTNALNAPSATINLSGTAVFENLTAQTINFTKPASPVTYGAKPITLVATGGASGNPVVFSVASGPASVTGATLTITGAGTVVVAANQAGNSTFAAAPQVTATLVVSKAELVIKANNVTVRWGVAFPKFTYTPTGFVNGDTVKVLTGAPKESTTLTDHSPVGVYEGALKIGLGTLKAANYLFLFRAGNITIEPAGPTKPPVLHPLPGTYETAQSVTITDPTPGAVIYYTTNGATPVVGALDRYTAGKKIAVTKNTTIKAIAVAPGYTRSLPVTGIYIIKTPTKSPNIVPAGGTFASNHKVSVTITDGTTGAVIYYTLDGKAPTAKATRYMGKFNVSAASGSVTVKAIAIAPGHSQSDTASATFHF